MSNNNAAPKSFWESYERISAKLKKRFMRKVNFAEVSAEFDELSKSLARDGNHQYAAFCAMAVARCEQVMQNAANEASATSEAARLFWEAEQESQSYRFSVDGSNYGYEEYFLEAVDCYELAIEQYRKLDNIVMAAQLQTELAHNLKSLRKYDESALHFAKAVTLHQEQSTGLIQPLYCLDCSLECRLLMRDFRGSIDVLVSISNLASTARASKAPNADHHGGDYFRHKILESELTRILLLLIERVDMRIIIAEIERVAGRPVSRPLQDAAAPLAGLPLTSKVTYIPPAPAEHGVLFDSDTSALIESLVMAGREGDAMAAGYLESLLWPDMTDIQRDLFKIYVDTCQGSL